MSARRLVLAALALLGALAWVPAAGAQRPVPRPTTRPRTPVTRPPAPRDTTRRAVSDSARRAAGDTARAADDTTKRELVEWEEPDSVMQELLSRPGYSSTRYQGARVTFEARDRTLVLEGKPAAVQRGEATLVGDTIVYNDSLNIVQVRSDTAILRDPSYQPDDVVARRYLEYDLTRRIGTVRDISTAVESGQRWFLHGTGGAQFVNDTSAARKNTFYVRGGEITSCAEAEPHYHFSAQEIKFVAKNLMVARPAVLYIGKVPVLWLPFIFHDMRDGRRSGIITPRFGVSELVRNGPTYRRQVDNFGYYWAISDFMDATASLDWRSSARATSADPGYIRYNADWQYHWIDRFMSGALRTSHDRWRDGRRNTAVTWGHRQQFSQRTSFNANVNYATSSQVVRQSNQNPFAAFASIRSDANFQSGIGPLNIAMGGNRTQYTNRPEVQLTFPTLTLTTQGPLSIGEWLTWTPSVNLTNSQTSDYDIGELGRRFVRRPDNSLDTTRIFQDRRTTNLSFSSPIRIFDFDLSNAVTITENDQKGPSPQTVYDLGDTVPRARFFDHVFKTELSYDPQFSLPRVLQGKWNITPSVSLRNVQNGTFGVRSTFSGGEWIFQRKRPSFGLTTAPTVFGLFPGFGPISRIRHAVNPVLSWSYSPDATKLFSAEYARAQGAPGRPDVSVLAQNQVSLGLTQTIEAKLRSGSDTALDGGRKIKLLALNFTPLTYDFVRADTLGRGLVSTQFGYDARSDLLPGFDFRTSYSLFDDNLGTSDTSNFKPYRTSMAANMSLNANSAIMVGLARLFGVRGPSSAEIETDQNATGEQALVQQNVQAQQIAGTGSRTAPIGIPSAGQGWNMTLGYSETRSRPIRGSNVVVLDPRTQCEQFLGTPFFDPCVLNAQATSTTQTQNDPLFQGSTRFVSPPQRTLNAQTTFNITPKWAAQWATSYDLVRSEFGMHQVSLQRELHDWRAIFAFTQSPNGAFAFNFFISLNAQPDIKFDYNRRSFRQR